jgi:hypothetical protein
VFSYFAIKNFRPRYFKSHSEYGDDTQNTQSRRERGVIGASKNRRFRKKRKNSKCKLMGLQETRTNYHHACVPLRGKDKVKVRISFNKYQSVDVYITAHRSRILQTYII